MIGTTAGARRRWARPPGARPGRRRRRRPQPAPQSRADPGTDVLILADPENTPLARLTIDDDDGGTRWRPLSPLGRHGGLRWDPALRSTAAVTRTRMREAAGGGRVLALVMDDILRADLDHAADTLHDDGAEAMLLAIPVARRARPPGDVGWAGRTRAAIAFGEALAARTATAVVPVVVPRPGGVPATGWPVPDIGDVLAAYGAARAVGLAGLRSPAERHGIAALAGVPREAAVRAVYPEASRRRDPPRRGRGPRRGAVVLFTGLSGSSKSTSRIPGRRARDSTHITLLDGDEVRQRLGGAGLRRASRERNVERIGWVAAQGRPARRIAIAAPIAPVRRLPCPGPAMASRTARSCSSGSARRSTSARRATARACTRRAGRRHRGLHGNLLPVADPDDAGSRAGQLDHRVEQAVASIHAPAREQRTD